MPTTFAVLGSGAWGTAIAIVLAQNPDHRVRLWSAHEVAAREISKSRENTRLLPGVRIPESIQITHDSAEATADADCWFTAIPTAFLRDTTARLVSVRNRDVPI